MNGSGYIPVPIRSVIAIVFKILQSELAAHTLSEMGICVRGGTDCARSLHEALKATDLSPCRCRRSTLKMNVNSSSPQSTKFPLPVNITRLIGVRLFSNLKIIAGCESQGKNFRQARNVQPAVQKEGCRRSHKAAEAEGKLKEAAL